MRRVKVMFVQKRGSAPSQMALLHETTSHPDSLPPEGAQVVLPGSQRVMLVLHHRYRYTKTRLAEVRVIVRPVRKHEVNS